MESVYQVREGDFDLTCLLLSDAVKQVVDDGHGYSGTWVFG